MKLQKPKKTIKVATWPTADGTWFETEIEKRGRWFYWYDNESSGIRGSDHIDGPRRHAEDRGGHIEKRPNPRYDDEIRAYRYNQSIRMITGVLR